MSDEVVKVVAKAMKAQGAVFPTAGARLIIAALKNAGMTLQNGFTEEWAVFSERNSRGEIVNVQLSAADREHAEELAQSIVDRFRRRHEGVSGAGIVKPEPEVRTRFVGPWREVSSDE